jgi:hypothetical protein
LTGDYYEVYERDIEGFAAAILKEARVYDSLKLAVRAYRGPRSRWRKRNHGETYEYDL